MARGWEVLNKGWLPLRVEVQPPKGHTSLGIVLAQGSAKICKTNKHAPRTFRAYHMLNIKLKILPPECLGWGGQCQLTCRGGCHNLDTLKEMKNLSPDLWIERQRTPISWVFYQIGSLPANHNGFTDKHLMKSNGGERVNNRKPVGCNEKFYIMEFPIRNRVNNRSSKLNSTRDDTLKYKLK